MDRNPKQAAFRSLVRGSTSLSRLTAHRPFTVSIYYNYAGRLGQGYSRKHMLRLVYGLPVTILKAQGYPLKVYDHLPAVFEYATQKAEETAADSHFNA